MSTPAIIFLLLLFLQLVTGMAQHGKSKGTWNAGVTLLDVAVTIALLYWGGFFS